MKKNSYESDEASYDGSNSISIEGGTKKGIMNVYEYSRFNQAHHIK